MNASLPEGKKIIYGVLNWGLGHASRSIPLIRLLIQADNQLILAGDGESLQLLQKEFPSLKTIQLKPYNVRYTNKLWSIVIKNTPNIVRAILSENLRLKKIVRQHSPDIVISDSRFGFYHRTIPSYIISHQLKLKIDPGWLSFMVNRVNAFLLNSYEQVWVPDEEDRKLSGDLSYNKNIPDVAFLGPLSRMKKLQQKIAYDLCVVLSGPEPSRSILEEKLVAQLKHEKHMVCFVRGTNEGAALSFPDNWKVFPLVGTDLLNSLICSSRVIISRSGYSSILDYYKMGTRAILIPTPGQSEQEYLGEMLDGKYGFRSILEPNIDNLSTVLSKSAV